MRILSMQSWSHDRGIDRIREVACEMPGDQFIVAGRPKRAGWPSNVDVVGHIEPSHALSTADVLLRLTRRNDPWGRDIIESLSMGVPVVATGSWQGYVQQGVTGYLIGEYDCAKAVKAITQAFRLNPTPDTRFSGANAKRVEAIYERVVAQ